MVNGHYYSAKDLEKMLTGAEVAARRAVLTGLSYGPGGPTCCKVRGLGEGSDGELRIFKDFKKIEDADEFEGLDGKF